MADARSTSTEPTSITVLIEERRRRKAQMRERFGKPEWWSRLSKSLPFVLVVVLLHLLWSGAVVYNTVNDSITSHKYKQGKLEKNPVDGVYVMLVVFTVVGAIFGTINFALHLARAVFVIVHYCTPQWQQKSFDILSAAPDSDLDSLDNNHSKRRLKRYKELCLSMIKSLRYYLSLCTTKNFIKMCSHDKSFYTACLTMDVFTVVLESAPQSLIGYLAFDIIHKAPRADSVARLEMSFEIYCLVQCFMAAISLLLCLGKHGCKGWMVGIGFFAFFAGILVLRCAIPALYCQSTGNCPP